MRDPARYFSTEWPDAARRIARLLQRHGVPACDREDVLQETALRLYRAWPTLDDARAVEPYAVTVALNLVRDTARRPRAEVVADVPDVPDAGDVVERTTLARIELGRVRRVLPRLRPTELSVLRDAVAAELGPSPAVTPASVRMARMRARRQLVALLGAASAWVAGLAAVCRRSVRVARPQRLALAATAAVAAVLALGASVPAGPRSVPVGPGAAELSAGRRDVAVRPAAAPAAVARHAVVPSASTRRAARAAAPKPAYVDLPVAHVDLLLDVSAGGFRVQVRDRGDQVPFCVRTPAGPPDPTLDCAS